MDLKILLAKLDKLDNRQVLMENSNIREEILSTELQLLKESYSALMERVHKRELDALKAINSQDQRRKLLGALATKHGYPGLFDPVTGKWVDSSGDFAWFGPYQSEVEQMERDGLVPPEAHTSAFYGLMGKDHDTALAGSNINATKFEMVDGADEIIDKANQSKGAMDESASKGSIAKALTEGFGYSFKPLAESISTTEHLRLKGYIEKLNSTEYKSDKDVQSIIFKYQEYVKYRDLLIAKIDEALTRLKARMQAIKNTPAPKAADVTSEKPDALKTPREIGSIPGGSADPRTDLKESRGILNEEFYVVPHRDNTTSVVHFYLDESGNVVNYVITEDIEALGRGAMDGLTFGWGDNAVAKIISMYKGTPYGEELIRQVRASEAAKERAKVWYYGGQFLGGMGWGGTSLVGNAAVVAGSYVSDKIREPINAKDIEDYKKSQADKLKKVQRTVGVEPTGAPDAKTINAVKLNAAPVTAPIATNPSYDTTELFAAFNTSNMDGVFKQLKSAGVDTYEKLGQMVAQVMKVDPVGSGASPKMAAESITYSSMSESERMAYLRNRLSSLEEDQQLDEAKVPVWLIDLGIGLFGSAAAKGLAGIEKYLGKGVTELILPKVAGGTVPKVWKLETTGANAGKWSTSGQTAGTRVYKTADEIMKDLQAAVNRGFQPRARPGQPPLPTAPANGLVKPGAEIASMEHNGVKYIKDAEGNWYSKNASTGVHLPVTDRALITTLEQGAVKTGMIGQLASKYPKIAAGFKGIGAMLKYGWSKKWWIALAAIIAAGYWAWSKKKEEPEPPPEPTPIDGPVDKPPVDGPLGPLTPGGPEGVPPGPDGKCGPGYTLDPKTKMCFPDGKKPQGDQQQFPPAVLLQADNIRKLMKQLRDMYPADKETRDKQAEVDDALQGIPESAQQTAPGEDKKGPPKSSYAI
jgi:hypothetical protein